ncbi:helix-turn-helix domain-containing protein [Actinoplanes auranticolor]|uniref:Transcriptional regulator n=1 Tax=Actinoplanes auranticolor TaxID=47988 RepID=A0A919VR82_9ACTN|nr:helix-turn-helix domain-containing protein [Actinoplanes auranticolor]GIM72897.1 transcriptional regulator [Actinoplanes auranticolor]
MAMTSGGLLTTGEVAKLLGTSRQQVVNLCGRGDLPFVMVGKHRRIDRSAVEALLRPERKLTRDQLKSLWLHQAVAGSLVTDPEAVLGKAAENLDRLLVQHQGTMAEVWLLRWRDKLGAGPGAGPGAVLEALTSPDPESVELRQNSPFAGVLSQPQRQQVLEAFTRSGWGQAA